jgi:hypothetical protein
MTTPDTLNARSPSERELHFYYFGLYKALKRYRFSTVLGWLIVLVGCSAVPLGWQLGGPRGAIDIVLSVCTVVAGLVVVQQAVASLSSYLTVPFASTTDGEQLQEPPLVIKEIIDLMNDVEAGGWQEAYAAIRKLKEIETSRGLPALDEQS